MIARVRSTLRCRTCYRLFWSMLWLVPLLAGCGEGEEVVLPYLGPACDRPPDSGWHMVAPLNGNEGLFDGVWLPDDTVVVIGTGGLIMTHQDGSWRKDRLAGVGPLHVAAATAGGKAVVAGKDGALAVRHRGGWSLIDLGVADNLREVHAAGDSVWVVGRGGQVAVGDLTGPGAGDWTLLPSPGDEDLTGVCALNDTLFVSGPGGRLLAWSGGGWSDETPLRLVGQDIHSIIPHPEGSLLAMADSLYRRRGSRWEPVRNFESERFIYGGDRLKLAGGCIWYIGSYSILKLLPRGDTMDAVSCGAGSGPDGCAPRDSLAELTFTRTGVLRWADREADVWRYDPAGVIRDADILQFRDGTTHIVGQEGLFTLTDHGLRAVDPPINMDYWLLRQADIVDGSSIRDFYLMQWRHFMRYRDGALVELHEFEESSYDNGMVMDEASGHVYLGSRRGLYCWDGTSMSLAEGFPAPPEEGQLRVYVKRTGAGSIVVWGPPGFVYELIDGQWRETPVEVNLDFCLQIPGEPLTGLYATYTQVHGTRIWLIALDGLPAEPVLLDPTPACPEIDFGGFIDAPTGLYVLTGNQASIYHAGGSPLAGEWDVVAGPLEYRLDELVILPDGTFLANTDMDRLYRYAPNP